MFNIGFIAKRPEVGAHRPPAVRLAAVLLLALATLGAAPPAVAAPRVDAALLAESAVLGPGRNQLAVRLSPQAGWHTYWRNPGDAGQPTELSWILPPGFTAGAIDWPVPRAFVTAGVANIGYDRPTMHLVAIEVPATAVGGVAELQVEASWLACADACIPEHATLRLQRPVAAAAIADPAQAAAFAAARQALPQPLARDMQYRVADGRLLLRISAAPPALRGAALRFFPYDEQWLDGSQKPQLRWNGDDLLIEQTLLGDAQAPPTALDGVLAMEGEPAQAWRVHAQPQPLRAAAETPALAASSSYLLVLLLAFAGGLVLNLMPCVFPVLSIKAVSLLQGSADPARQHRQALIYTAGVVLSCVGIATALLLLRAGGQALGWGFQLQSPFFVGLLAYLMFVMALSLSGALEIGSGLMGVGQHLAGRDGDAGSFFTGVLAVIVASPCTAPFMGTALGYAMTQSWPVALSVFAALGLGLASPFLLLAWWPAAARLLPRPGAWMETFKQAMAFPLYFTVIWLLWVLGRQAGMTAVIAALAGLVLLAFGAWCLPRAAWLRRGLAPASLAAALALIATPWLTAPVAAAAADGAGWEVYSDARLEQLRAEGRPVFVNLTADWCITCKVNERVALDTEAAHRAYAAQGVVRLKGDWTRSDPAITAVLQRFGRNGVPLYVVFPPHGEPRVLPQLLSPAMIVDALGATGGA